MNRQETKRFLYALTDDRQFTFQTFDDSAAKAEHLNRMRHGSFDQHAAELEQLNADGAGVFVTVNRTDLKGRKIENVVAIRALFVDLDGAPIEPVLDYEHKPHVVVESSPGKWHAYWLVAGMPLDRFEGAQRRLIAMFGADPSVIDLPRVMRLPGFIHRKAEPYETRLASTNDAPPYPADLFGSAGPKRESKKARTGVGDMNRLNDLALDNLPEWVPLIFPSATAKGDGYRVSSESLGRKLEEDISITPKGIKDFGVHDIGDKREGKRTPVDLIVEHAGKTVREATDWLRELLGFSGVTKADFWAYMPSHSYIFTPTGEMWPAGSVNSRVGRVPLFNANGTPKMELNKKGEPTGEQATVAASQWLDWKRPVEQMTWAPGDDIVIRDRLIADGGWFERLGTTCFNQYRPPTIKHGDAALAQPWIDHVAHVYPEDAGHIIRWFAQRVQDPANKVNHCIVLGGEPGIGKDTLLEPLKQAVGPWNFADITPQHLLGRFNGFAKSVVLRISEARDLDVNQYQFYEHTKNYMASPPDVMRVDEKHMKEHAVVNCCGVVITTNHKTNGIYLPANDRRHYVAWSERTEADYDEGYWNRLWAWYAQGGLGHVAAYLATADISDFDPKRPPPKTAAFWAIVDANRSSENAEFEQAIEELGHPEALCVEQLMDRADDSFRGWLRDRKNRKAVPHRFEQCGYVPVRNDLAKDGLWKIGGKRQVAYVQKGLEQRQKLAAAGGLTGGNANVTRGEGDQYDIPL